MCSCAGISIMHARPIMHSAFCEVTISQLCNAPRKLTWEKGKSIFYPKKKALDISIVTLLKIPTQPPAGEAALLRLCTCKLIWGANSPQQGGVEEKDLCVGKFKQMFWPIRDYKDKWRGLISADSSMLTDEQQDTFFCPHCCRFSWARWTKGSRATGRSGEQTKERLLSQSDRKEWWRGAVCGGAGKTFRFARFTIVKRKRVNGVLPNKLSPS